MNDTYYVLLKIKDSDDICRDFYHYVVLDKIKTLSTEPIMKCIIEIKYILSKIKFCKLSSEFRPDIDEINYKRKLITSIFQCDNVKMNSDICSVCHDFTRHKLKCNHHLCVLCFQTMRQKMKDDMDDEQDEPDDLSCPLCRKEFSIYQYY